MSRDRLSQIMKMLPPVQFIASLLVGVATAIAAGAVFKANLESSIREVQAKNTEQDEAIKAWKVDHDVLIRVDQNVQMLLKAQERQDSRR